MYICTQSIYFYVCVYVYIIYIYIYLFIYLFIYFLYCIYSTLRLLNVSYSFQCSPTVFSKSCFQVRWLPPNWHLQVQILLRRCRRHCFQALRKQIMKDQQTKSYMYTQLNIYHICICIYIYIYFFKKKLFIVLVIYSNNSMNIKFNTPHQKSHHHLGCAQKIRRDRRSHWMNPSSCVSCRGQYLRCSRNGMKGPSVTRNAKKHGHFV